MGFFNDDCENESVVPSTAGMFSTPCTLDEALMTNQGFFQTEGCAPAEPCFSRGSFFIDYCLEDIDDTGCIPYVPPGGPPPQECLPYACNAISTVLEELAPGTITAYAVGDADTPYPFDTERPGNYGAPDKFSAWNWYISGPTQIKFWTAYPGIRDVTDAPWYDDLQNLQLCTPESGDVPVVATHIGEFEANASVTSVTIPTKFLDVPRTGSTSSALVTGYRGQALGSLNFQNNQAGRVAITENGVVTAARSIQVYAAFTNTGMRFGTGDGSSLDTGEIDFGEPLEGQWLYVTQTVSARAEFGFPGNNETQEAYRVYVRQTVMMTRADTGETLTDTCEGYEEYIYFIDGKTRDWEPWHDPTFYDSPYMFRGQSTSSRISWAFLSHGDYIGEDHTELHTAFKRSITTYTPPAYCET